MNADPAFLQNIFTLPRGDIGVVQVSSQSRSKATDKSIRRNSVFLLIPDHEPAQTIFLHVDGDRGNNAGTPRLIRTWF